MEDQSNHGKPWSKEEKGKILPAIKEGKSISEIAKDHKRKIGGIRAQLGRIANELNSQNKSIEEIGILTGLNKGEIEESIETYQNRSNKSSGSGWKGATPIELIKDLNKLYKEINQKQEKIRTAVG